MKILRKSKLKILLVAMLLICCLASCVYAEGEDAVVTSEQNEETSTNTEESSTTTNAVSTSTVTKKDKFLGGDSITIDSPISGNVFIMANKVTIDTTIDGNVFVMAEEVTLDSNTYIYSDLFVMANKLTISGAVYDVYAMANNMEITSGAYIIRDITAAAKSLNLSGYIKRNANLTFDTVQIDETTCQIGGDLSYSASSEAIPSSIVRGATNYNKSEEKENVVKDVVKGYIANAIRLLIIALVVILIVTYATPKFAEKEQEIMENKALPTLGYGALALIVIPVICLIAFCTIIGILPSIILLLTYIFIITISSAVISIPFGRFLCKKMNKESKGMNVLMSLVTVLVIWLIEKIPVLGGIVSLFAAMFALGLIVYAMFHKVIDKKTTEKETVVIEKEDKK